MLHISAYMGHTQKEFLLVQYQERQFHFLLDYIAENAFYHKWNWQFPRENLNFSTEIISLQSHHDKNTGTRRMAEEDRKNANRE